MLRCDQIDETISYLEMVFDDKCRIPSADDLELVVQLIQAVALCVEGELQMSKFFVNGDSGPQLEIGNETVLSFSGSDEIAITTSNPSTVTITLSELVKNKINNALVIGDDISLLNNNVGYITGISWGDIGGTLSDQTDLINILNNKFDTPTGTISQYIRGDGSLANFPTIPTAFTGLVDTPSNYTGAGKKVVRVKEDETGLDFSSVLYIDEVNKRIGINTATPDQPLTILRPDGNPLFRVVPATGTNGTKIIGYQGNSPYNSGVLEIGGTGLIFETNGGNFRIGSDQNGFSHSSGQVTISKDGGNPRITFRDHPSYFRLSMNPAGDLFFNNDTEDVVVFNNSGAVVFNKYGTGAFVGTPAKMLAVTSNGNVIEEDLPTPAEGLTITDSDELEVEDVNTINFIGATVTDNGDGSVDVEYSGGEVEQYFVEITEGVNTGYAHKYRADNPDNYGNIGDQAIDLSYSTAASSIMGALGGRSFLTGVNNRTSTSGYISVIIGGENNHVHSVKQNIIGGTDNTNSSSAAQNSVILGGNNNKISGSSGANSVILGGYNNLNWASEAFLTGVGHIGRNSFETLFGRYSTDYTPTGKNSLRLFNIGFGDNASSRKDLFSILRSGKVGIGYNLFNPSNDSELLQVNGSVLIEKTLKLNDYGEGNITGTATKLLAVDADGKVIEEDLPTSESVDWDAITGDQSVISLGGFTNDVGFTTNTGTVTSVAISGSDGIEVDSGSPVTGSGTIVLGINASSLRSHINVEDGAQANVKADWNSVSGDSEILNKPTLVTEFTGLSDTPANYSGQGGKAVAVNSGGTALEFVEFPDITPFNLVVDDGDEEVSNVNKINFVGATVTDNEDGSVDVELESAPDTLVAWCTPFDEDVAEEAYPAIPITKPITLIRAWIVASVNQPTGNDLKANWINRSDGNAVLASFTIPVGTKVSNVVTSFGNTVSVGDFTMLDVTQVGSVNAGGGIVIHLEYVETT